MRWGQFFSRSESKYIRCPIIWVSEFFLFRFYVGIKIGWSAGLLCHCRHYHYHRLPSDICWVNLVTKVGIQCFKNGKIIAFISNPTMLEYNVSSYHYRSCSTDQPLSVDFAPLEFINSMVNTMRFCGIAS